MTVRAGHGAEAREPRRQVRMHQLPDQFRLLKVRLMHPQVPKTEVRWKRLSHQVVTAETIVFPPCATARSLAQWFGAGP